MKSITSNSTTELPALTCRSWRVFPIFWTVLFGGILSLNTLGLFANHPERLQGWQGIGLCLLLSGAFGTFVWLNWGYTFRNGVMPFARLLALMGAQLLILALLVRFYDLSFGWLSIALLYQVIGQLPRRHWPLPLAGIMLVIIIGALPLEDGGSIDFASIISGFVLCIVNAGIALFMRMLFTQRDQLSAALAELQQAHAQLAANAAQGEELAVLRERTRLARAMHDNIGHALVVMNVKLEAAQLLYARDHELGDAELAATRTLIRATMTDLRRALADLRAPATAYDDLPAALTQLAHELQTRTGISMICSVAPDLPPLSALARETIWQVAREALTNIERHAAATSAALALTYTDDGWRLEVSDNGSGIRPADLRRPEHYGVVGMRERMAAIGGTLDVERCIAGGTLVAAHLPARVVQEVIAR